MRWQTGAAVALLAALSTVAVFAFAQDGGTPQVEASAPPTATASPSPSPETPSPSQSPSPGLVLPDNDVEDPLEAILAIEAYRDWLFENPDPDLVRFIYHPDCFCTESLKAVLENLVAQGRRLRLVGHSAVSEPKVVREDTERIVLVEYFKAPPAYEVVGPDGTLISEQPAGEAVRSRVALLRSDGGRWIVTHVEELS